MGMLITFLCVSGVIVSPAFSDSPDSDDYVPCDAGWYYFQDKCYRAGSRKLNEGLTWTSALDRCKKSGGDLVSIYSQEEQDFVVAFLLLDMERCSFIGLNNRDKKGDFTWSDGSISNYSNWNKNERLKIPFLGTIGCFDENMFRMKGSYYNRGGAYDECMEMVLYPLKGIVGQWNDVTCDTKRAYMCEKKTNPRKRSSNLKYCSPEEGGGWKHHFSCYHVVTESKSWQDAERHCKNIYKGHLLTIRDMLEDYFLELGIPDIRQEMWIGIKIRNQIQQKWTSGWYVSYNGFNKEENTFIEGNCVARKGRAEWLTIPCSRPLPFICEVSKAKPPVLKLPPVGAHCPTELDDWRDLGGDQCYYFGTEKHVNFFEARYDCGRRGGDLASLHSKEETDILQPFVIHKTFSVLIGLMRLYAYNEETFGWLDGSKLDYQKWREDAPNRLDEKCVEVFTDTMKWNDNTCEDKKYGYICSVKKIVPHSSLVNKNAGCKNYCVTPYSYLDGLVSQCPDAKEIL